MEGIATGIVHGKRKKGDALPTLCDMAPLFFYTRAHHFLHTSYTSYSNVYP